MKTINTWLQMEKVQFGELVDLGQLNPAYYANRGKKSYFGTLSGTVYFTLRREGTSILEEEIDFPGPSCKPEVIGVIVHDSGLSGDWAKYDMWLKGVEQKKAS